MHSYWKIAGASLLLTAFALVAQQQKLVDVQVVGHVLKPSQTPATDDRVAALKVPAGFRIDKFADGLEKPRMLAVTADGSVYVTRREPGDCILLKDTDGDGRADQRRVVAEKKGLHGVAFDGDRVYLVTVKEVFSTERRADGTFGELKQIISDLPDGGQHPNRTLAIGPDHMLYISVGSTCNECAETNDESATVLRMKPDGTAREIFASGLRNTIGFGWHLQTGEMWGMDHGIDWLGDNEHGEELNQLVQGARYGWPVVYDKGKFNPAEEAKGTTKEEWARSSKEPVLLYTPHAAPMQMAFYTRDQFPPEYRGGAFVAMHGSWNRKPPSGYEVVHIRFQDGKPVEFKPFLTGFLFQENGKPAIMGRPTGIAVDRTGALLVSDDANGVIYRVSHGATQSSRRQPSAFR